MAILDSVTDILAGGYTLYSQKEQQDRQFELAKMKVQTQAAMVRKEAEIQAAQNASSLLENNTLRQVVMWTLTTIAGGVLTMIVLKAAGIK